MAQYSEYLSDLLRPLGIYDLQEGSYSGSELAAVGRALDEIGEELEKWEKESILTTAEGEGLDLRTSLFSLRPVDAGPALRRAALMALGQVGGDSFTLDEINAAIQGCGVAAEAVELPERGHIRILFPHTAGIPDHFEQIRKVIEALIPCHLALEFYFRYLTWEQCHAQQYTWDMVHTRGHTWNSFQLAVPV